MYFLISLYLIMSSVMLFFTSMILFLFKIKFLIKLNLFKILSFNIEFIIFLDWMTLSFISVVLIISSMVLIYSMEYMYNNFYTKRFMIMIMIFFMSMMLMIISPNMISILFGWDGLGLSSYCLIIFYQNKKSYNSGMITILMNRVGDISIIMMVSLLISSSSLNFLFINNNSKTILFFIMLAAITKSAQIPFSSWLPLAMAAPTPVSSLVHSSTLVTAGVYLLIRLNFLLNKKFLITLMLISIWTILMSSSSALMEFDLKKIIALSTLSQLSLMFLALSMKFKLLSFFHLITHAMFKSLLFLCSGIIIHNCFNNQDIRMISLMNINMPLTNMIFNVASMTLCGMPFLSGFYSKDLIIEMFNMFKMNYLMFNLMYLSMMMTVMYSMRLIFYISLKSPKLMMFNKNNSNNLMNYSIYMLFFFSVFYGSMMNWFLFNSINLILLNLKSKILIWKLILLSMIIMILVKMKINLKKFLIKLMYFFNQMWFLNLMFKKMKMIIYLMNLNLIINENTWMEYISSKNFFYLSYLINNFKNFNKLNFSMMMTFMSYLTIYMII